MAQYILYKRSDTSNPFVIVNENTIDSSATSVFLIGKRKESYGEPEQQSKVWMLENFANNTPPATPMVGQEWFNMSDSKMYVCVDGAGTFTKVGSPIVAANPPSGVYVKTGDLWYNTSDGILYVFDAPTGTWHSSASGTGGTPSTIQRTAYLTAVTNDNTPTVMNLSGVVGTQLTIDPNESWNVNLQIIGKRNTTISEVAAFNINVLVDRNDSDPIAIIGGINKQILGISGTFANTLNASVIADTANNALSVIVTGETSKIINWTATATITIAANA
jgi:hypothetical protein